jgi:type II secretory pathway component PulF
MGNNTMKVNISSNIICTCIDENYNKRKITIPESENKKIPDITKNMGLTLISNKKKTSFNITSSNDNSDSFILKFTQQLQTLLSSGLTLAESIFFIKQHEKNKSSSAIINNIYISINKGNQFHTALAENNKLFSKYYISIIKAAEQSGSMERSIRSLLSHIKATNKIKKEIKKSLIYPCSLLSITIIACYALIGFILPKFTSLFNSFDKKLPKFTQIVISMANILQSSLTSIIILFIITAIIISIVLKKRKYKKYFHNILNKTPGINTIINHYNHMIVSRILHNTMQENISIIESLKICQQASNFIPVSDKILLSLSLINAGATIHNAFSVSSLFQQQDLQLIASAENSNQLPSIFATLTKQHKTEFEAITSSIQKSIEPIILIILAIVVGSVIMAIYLPIFNMGSVF